MREPSSEIARTRFTKSNFCRVIRVDGAWGSVTPQFNIHMALFSERWSLPAGTSIGPDPEADGTLKDFPREVPLEIEREVEVNVILDERAAAFLRDWLTEKIVDLQTQQARGQSGQTGSVGD